MHCYTDSQDLHKHNTKIYGLSKGNLYKLHKRVERLAGKLESFMIYELIDFRRSQNSSIEVSKLFRRSSTTFYNGFSIACQIHYGLLEVKWVSDCFA